MQEFGIESLSSAQANGAAKLLDAVLEAWRNRPQGEIRYLILDARYEKVREGGLVRDAAVLSAIGMGPDLRRRVLGVSCTLADVEVHWRAFLESLVQRGMRGLQLWSPRTMPACAQPEKRSSVAPSGKNAIHHAPSRAIRTRIGTELHQIWNAQHPRNRHFRLERRTVLSSCRHRRTSSPAGSRP